VDLPRERVQPISGARDASEVPPSIIARRAFDSAKFVGSAIGFLDGRGERTKAHAPVAGAAGEDGRHVDLVGHEDITSVLDAAVVVADEARRKLDAHENADVLAARAHEI
jgi:hypothetical protein